MLSRGRGGDSRLLALTGRSSASTTGTGSGPRPRRGYDRYSRDYDSGRDQHARQPGSFASQARPPSGGSGGQLGTLLGAPCSARGGAAFHLRRAWLSRADKVNAGNLHARRDSARGKVQRASRAVTIRPNQSSALYLQHFVALVAHWRRRGGVEAPGLIRRCARSALTRRVTGGVSPRDSRWRVTPPASPGLT